MSKVVLISGSPAFPSKSNLILKKCEDFFKSHEIRTQFFNVRDFPAEDLFNINNKNSYIERYINEVSTADTVIIATPIYKGSFSGTLKAVLDILPQYAFKSKNILPIATAGSYAHLLSIDYALKPVLSVLGASNISQGIYITDEVCRIDNKNQLELDVTISERLYKTLQSLKNEILIKKEVYGLINK